MDPDLEETKDEVVAPLHKEKPSDS
jgi:GTPase